MSTIKPIDIVICSKNNERTIGECLRRVRTFGEPQRLIVIDGESRDQTRNIASEAGAEIHSDHGKGLGYARDMALEIVETPLFGYVDADAYITQNWRSLLTHFDDEKVAAANSVTLFGYGNPPLQRLHEWLATSSKIDVTFASTIVRKSALQKVGGIRQDLMAYEDWELYQRISHAGLKWIYDRTVVTLHPQTMRGYLTHARHWGQGARKSGVSRSRFLRAFITSPYWAMRIARTAHPIHAFYYPLLRLSYLTGALEA